MATVATYDNYAGYYSQLVINQQPPEAAFMREFYRVLFAYYSNNGLYDYLNDQMKATKTTGQPLKPLMNPAWRVAEFYAAKLFPGKLPEALELVTDNDKIIDPIHLIWERSNFSSLKQRLARWFAIYGDLFIKIGTKKSQDKVDSVIFTLIRPEHVSDFEMDERGFLTWIRIDVAVYDDEGKVEEYHTEVWDKESQTVNIWVHEQELDVDLDSLPEPTFSYTFEETHGEDFIPIVYQSFRDDGGGRASGAYSAQLDKIDEANRQATRLGQILFRYNKPVWAATGTGNDDSGRPMPAPSFEGMASAGAVTFGDDQILSFPGSTSLQPLVPPLNYADALAVLNNQMEEITMDLPELAFYQLRGVRDLSGTSVRFLLDDMISRVMEARGNAETALARANAMAISVGQNFGLWNVGDYKNGDFRHSFVPRPVLPADSLQVAQTFQTYASAGANLKAAAELSGLSEEDANKLSALEIFEGER